MLRVLVLVLLLANALFFAWSRGWLGPPPRHGEREPERLAAQVRPESLRLLPPASATAAVNAARAASLSCLEAGPFTDTDLGVAEATLLNARLPAGSWSRAEPAPGATGSLLRVARADADLAERLRALPSDALSGGFRPCAARP